MGKNGMARSSKSWLDLVSFLSRFGLAAVWLYTGVIKMRDPMAFQQSVRAYQLFSPGIESLIAQLLPPTEVALGLLLLLGLFLRQVSAVTGLIMIGFMAGITSAWVRGLHIDCGCFSTSGSYNPNTYAFALIRDLLFLTMAVWTVWRPFNRFALHP